jgi:hypothetical protein
MRITKKYAGESSIGKQSYHPDENFFCNSMEVQKLNEQFIAVENAFLKKINDRSAVFSRETLRADSPNSDYDGERQSLRNQRNREKPAVFSDFYSEENLDSLDVFQESQGRRSYKDSSSFSEENLSVVTPVDAVLIREMSRKFVPRRSFSVPNLTIVDHAVQQSDSKLAFLAMQGSMVNSGAGEHRFATGSNDFDGSCTETAFATVGDIPRKWRKRSLSTMALMDFEKLVTDDRAADSLFMEFIDSMENLKRRHLEDSVGINKKFEPSTVLTPTMQQSQHIVVSNTVTPTAAGSNVPTLSSSKMQSSTEAVSVGDLKLSIASFASSNVMGGSRENSDLLLDTLAQSSLMGPVIVWNKAVDELSPRARADSHIISSDEEFGNFF